MIRPYVLLALALVGLHLAELEPDAVIPFLFSIFAID